MSFLAKLFVGDAEFNVLTAEYSLNRPVDSHQRPNGRLRGGIIDVTIESGSTHQLMNWIVNNMTMNGKIEFYRRDTASSTQKTVEFTNAFCIYLKDMFVADGATPMITRLTISAHEMNIDNETVSNTWAGVESSASNSSQSSGSTGENSTNSVTFD